MSTNEFQSSDGHRDHHVSPTLTQPAGQRDRSYLDDPNHVFALDPASHGACAETVLTGLLRRRSSPREMVLVMSGAERLFAGGAGTAAECLETSLIWSDG